MKESFDFPESIYSMNHNNNKKDNEFVRIIEQLKKLNWGYVKRTVLNVDPSRLTRTQ